MLVRYQTKVASTMELQIILKKPNDNTVGCSMGNSMLDKASAYDKCGLMKAEVDNALVLLKDFRAKFPFAENQELIDSLEPDDIFKMNPDELGEFFHYVEVYLKPLGHLTIHGSIVYRNIRAQIEDFKDLLYTVVDKKKSLAEKVDAPWEKISRLGQDKHIAKKIIFCFNYESAAVLPIFSTPHLRHFVNKVVDKPSNPNKPYYSLGEEYAYLTSELLTVKENQLITKPWEITYFARFLYNAYPPPDREIRTINPSDDRKIRNVVTKEQLEMGEFAKLLQALQARQKINGQQFREYRDMWTKQPNEREALTLRLKKLLNAQSNPPENF
jgi:hypothetical protein